METLSLAEREAAQAEAVLSAARERAARFSSPRQPSRRTPLTPATAAIQIGSPPLSKERSIKPSQDGFPAKEAAAPKIYGSRDKALLCVYTTVAIDMLGSALTVPVMPFFVESLGGDASMLGILFSTFAIAQMGAGLWMGAASDRVGRRPILLISLAGSAVGMLGSGLAPSYKWLLAWRFFLGSFSGTSSTANAYIADITSPSERPKLMSWIGVIASLCFMFGPGVGAGLSELDVRAPFYVGAFVGFAALFVAYFYLPPPEQCLEEQMPLSLRHPGSSKADKDENGKPIFKRRDSTIVPTKTQWSVVTIVGIGSLLTNTASSSLMVCQALWLAEVFNFRSLQFGFVMMATSVVGLTLRTLAFDRLQRSLGLMRCAAFGAVLSFLAYFGYSTIHLPPTFATRLALFSVCAVAGTSGMIFTSGSISPFLSRLATKETMGRVMSVASITSSAGRVIGPPLYGRLYMVDHPLTYRVAAAFAGAAGFAYIASHAAFKRRLKRIAEKEAGITEAMLEPMPAVGPEDEAAIKALQDLLREILVDRGYDIAINKLQLAAVLENAFPYTAGHEDSVDKLLEAAVHHSASHHHHLHSHCERMGH